MTRPDDSLEDAILAGVDGRLLDTHTQLRGNVLSYDEISKTCSVQIATKLAVPDGEGGIVFQALPDLPMVPVAWPSAGGFMLHWPLSIGDSVFVTFDEQDSQRWEATGSVSEPGWLERFGLSSALVHPYSRKTIATNGACMICPTPFSFGAGAAQFLALSNLVTAELNKIKAALASLTVTSGSGSGGLVVAGTPYATVGNVAAAKVKSE